MEMLKGVNGKETTHIIDWDEPALSLLVLNDGEASTGPTQPAAQPRLEDNTQTPEPEQFIRYAQGQDASTNTEGKQVNEGAQNENRPEPSVSQSQASNSIRAEGLPLHEVRPSDRRQSYLDLLIPRKSTWPKPRLSIGEICNKLGDRDCWQAIGPAGVLFDQIAQPIGDLLDTRMEEIQKGEPLADNIISYGMYMVGREPGVAHPTIIFTCKRPKPRRRAMKYVKESDILNGYPKIALAESSNVPMVIGRGYATLLAGLSDPHPASRIWTPRTDTFTTSESDASSIIPAYTKLPTYTSSYKPKVYKGNGANVKHARSPSRSQLLELPWNAAKTLKYDDQVYTRRSTPVTVYSLGDVVSYLTPSFSRNPLGPSTGLQAIVTEALQSSGDLPVKHEQQAEKIRLDSPEWSGLDQVSASPLNMTVNSASLPNATETQLSKNELDKPENVSSNIQNVLQNLKTHLPPHTTSLSPRVSIIPFSNENIHQDETRGITDAHTIECTTLYGMLIFAGRYATIGGTILCNGVPYGLTVRHTFVQFMKTTVVEGMWSIKDHRADHGGDADFAFDSDDEEDPSHILDASMTSQASLSSAASVSRSSSSGISESGQKSLSSMTTMTSFFVSEEDLTSANSFTYATEATQVITPFLTSDESGNDWALIKMSASSFQQARILRSKESWSNIRALPARIASKPVSNVDIVAIKSSIVARGTLFPSSTMMKLQPFSKFQEVWTVSFAQPIGDSGSWIIDAFSGNLYGHVVAGVLGTGTAFILPAMKTFQEIEKVLGPVQFSLDEIVSHMLEENFENEPSSV